MPPTLALERRAWDAGRLLVGVDEVGRGPLAGPVLAAAVVFPAGCAAIRGVRDSKQLSARQRGELLPRIRARALAIGVGAASVREIDRLNIRVATALAMRRALARVLAAHAGALVVVDGLPVPELGHEHEALVRADASCLTVAAAGIVAKQLRDGLMQRLALRHPGYAWEANMGYGSPAHLASLASVGPCAHHRRSFAPVAAMEERMA